MFLKSPTKKQRSSCVDTKASISKRNLKVIHGDQNLRRVRSKKRSSRILYYYTKKAAVFTTITTRSSEKAVQSNSRGRRLIVDDEREDLSQATPAGNVTSSKLQAVQFELPETATNATTSLNRPSKKPSISTTLIAQELIQQSFEQNEVSPIQTPHNSLITAYPFTNSNAISIIKDRYDGEGLLYIGREDRQSTIKLFKELGWSFMTSSSVSKKWS